MRFRDKVRKPKRPVVVYEILPPREKDGTLNSYSERISSLLSQTHIDAINIPEVHDENARGERPVKNLERAEAREFGRLLQDNVGIETIVNRVTVHEDIGKQKDWIKETFYDYDIENLILVGGESSAIDYPGPTVNATSEYITRDLNAGRFDFFCGGIAIPSRKTESKRLLRKGSNGIEFFTTQVLYDSSKIMKMFKYYALFVLSIVYLGYPRPFAFGDDGILLDGKIIAKDRILRVKKTENGAQISIEWYGWLMKKDLPDCEVTDWILEEFKD